MGGRISVESEPGRGSTFHFVVRLARSPRAAAGPPVRRGLPCRGSTACRSSSSTTTRRTARILVETLAGWGTRPVAVADGLGSAKR